MLLPSFILIVSQTSLSLMFVVLGIILIGAIFASTSKTKESLLRHRWTMSVAVLLASGAILLVMLPSAFNFYIDPNLQFLSSVSILTIVHGVVAAPAITLGLIYAFGDLPQKTKRWMHWAAVLWVVSIILGLLLFLEMMGLLPF